MHLTGLLIKIAKLPKEKKLFIGVLKKKKN